MVLSSEESYLHSTVPPEGCAACHLTQN